MTPHLLDERAAITATLDVGLEGVDAVYDHEPDRETSGACYVSVALERVTATEQVWAVRIYSQTLDSIEEGTTRLLTALESVDDALKDEPLGPSEWDLGFDDGIGCLVARTFLNRGRETF